MIPPALASITSCPEPSPITLNVPVESTCNSLLKVAIPDTSNCPSTVTVWSTSERISLYVPPESLTLNVIFPLSVLL